LDRCDRQSIVDHDDDDVDHFRISQALSSGKLAKSRSVQVPFRGTIGLAMRITRNDES
jgi:hypothetical protein